jgi:phosphoribosylformimino-5-aminoimidazole carboxamide ribotide isomerase
MDLRGGVVVRGVAGKRETYRPVESRLCTGATAHEVAEAFRTHFGLEELYIADLDAILDSRPNIGIWQALQQAGFRLWIDAGVRTEADAEQVLAAGARAVIVGLETVPGPELLGRLCSRCGNDRVVFSLDLAQGRPLGDTSGWRSSDPYEIAAEAVEAGVRRMIVLDLAAVGVNEGPVSLALCGRLRDSFPELSLVTGGGMRGGSDLRLVRSARVAGVLVATALHNGGVTRADIEAVE